MIACLPKKPLSEHFTSDEFACPCGTCAGGWIQPELVAKLEQLRARWGRYIKILSGYRCANHNRKESGAVGSLHLTGFAADIFTSPMTGHDIYELVKLAIELGFGGIGVRGHALHLDVRPYSCLWTYGDK